MKTSTSRFAFALLFAGSLFACNQGAGGGSDSRAIPDAYDEETSADAAKESLADSGQLVPLDDQMLKDLGIQSVRDDETGNLVLGYEDPAYEVDPNEVKEEDGKVSITMAALLDFFMEEGVAHSIQDGKIVLEDVDASESDFEEEIADDPDSPEDPELEPEVEEGEEAATALMMAKVKSSSILNYGLKFKGVKYVFGSGPYSKTKTFDCSSFTRHVFAHFGFKLPRTAAKQSRHGKYISSSKLRKGDLIFFHIPGRSRDPNHIGHVGIYMGGNKFLHTNPGNGVHVASLSGFWKRNFRFGRRLGGVVSASNGTSGHEKVKKGVSTTKKTVYRYYRKKNNQYWMAHNGSGARKAGFHYQGVGFRVYRKDNGSARKAVYSCIVSGTGDQFVSKDPRCEGRKRIGFFGYLATSSKAGRPLYRCYNRKKGHLATLSYSKCKKYGAVEGILGYAPQ